MTEDSETLKRKGGGKEAGGVQGGAKAKGKGKGDAGGEGAKAASKSETQIARLLVRAIWMQEWSAANREGKAEERKEAWHAAREGAVSEHLKAYRRALNMLSRAGVSMSYEAPAKKAGEDAEDDGGED